MIELLSNIREALHGCIHGCSADLISRNTDESKEILKLMFQVVQNEGVVDDDDDVDDDIIGNDDL